MYFRFDLGPGSPANITNPLPDAESLTDRERLMGGGSVEYTCEASGTPTPAITWYYNGGVLPSGAEVVGGTLTIQEPQVSDSGIYQCVAANNLDEEMRAWTLEIRRPGMLPAILCYHYTLMYPVGDYYLVMIYISHS